MTKTRPAIVSIRWILLTLVIAGSAWITAPSTRVSAQSPAQFDNVQISLWPEFDKPSMLVIYRANLPADTQFPVNVSLPVPAGVQPNAVAQGATDGRLVDVNYSLEQQSGREMVNLQVSNQLVWLEFYQDLTLNGSERTFEFQWPGGLSIPSLSIEVQNAPSISDLTLQPASTGEVVGEYGLTYKQVNLGAVGPTDEPVLDVAYTKVGQGLTVDSLPQTPVPSPTEPAVGSAPEPSQVVTYVLIGLVALLVVVVGILYFRVWRVAPQERQPRRRHRRRSRSSDPPTTLEAGEAGDEQDVYCHQCGRRADPQDRFCRSCGTPLRR